MHLKSLIQATSTIRTEVENSIRSKEDQKHQKKD